VLAFLSLPHANECQLWIQALLGLAQRETFVVIGYTEEARATGAGQYSILICWTRGILVSRTRCLDLLVPLRSATPNPERGQ
jgi:hypothetical protein